MPNEKVPKKARTFEVSLYFRYDRYCLIKTQEDLSPGPGKSFHTKM